MKAPVKVGQRRITRFFGDPVRVTVLEVVASKESESGWRVRFRVPKCALCGQQPEHTRYKLSESEFVDAGWLGR